MVSRGIVAAMIAAGVVAAGGSNAMAQVTPAIAPCSYYVALTGSDSAAGTQSAPLRTIQHSVNSLGSSGGSVCIEDAGPYAEAVTLQNSGTAGKWITIRGVGAARAEIAPPSSGSFAINVNSKSYVAIEHIQTNGGEIGIVSSGGGSHWYVNDSEIENAGGSGIQLNNGDYVTIEGNLVHNNGATWTNDGSGVSIYQPVQLDSTAGYHIYIGGNSIYSNQNPAGGSDGNGIILDTFSADGFSASSLVENNLGYGNAGACVKVYSNGGAPILVRNNTCFKDQQLVAPYTWRGEVSLEYAGGVTTVNNILWYDPTADSSNSAYLDGGNSGPANVQVSNISYGGSGATNPELVDPPSNLRLQSSSPAIGTGTSAYGVPSVDITGALRSPASVDIGAYAFGAAAPTATPSQKATAKPVSSPTVVATPIATPTPARTATPAPTASPDPTPTPTRHHYRYRWWR
ncbi:MAG: right-handed parallel beta-helix repeat-containing protein [Candidatus Binataceae bacterium]